MSDPNAGSSPGEPPNPYAPPPGQPAQPVQPLQPEAQPPQPYGTQPGQPAYQGYPAQQPGYPQPGYPQQPYGAAPGYGAPLEPPKGLSITALILGIVAILGFWVPVLGAGIGLVALILGIVAWRRAAKGAAGGQGMAITGAILGGVAMLAGIVVTIVTVWFVATASDCLDTSLTDAQVEACLNSQFGFNNDN